MGADDARYSGGSGSAIDLWLGQQLRETRIESGKSLAEVAKASSMSIGLLSQIERGRSTIAIDKLARVCSVLGLAADALIRNAMAGETSDNDGVARAGTHRRLDLDRMGVSKEVLTPGVSDHFNLYRIVVAPGGSSGDALFVTAPGEQIGYVVSGSLEIWVDKRMLRLNAGDSVRYSSESPRRWRNGGTTETVLIWTVMRTP